MDMFSCRYKCIGKIKAFDDGKPGIKYKWDYEWIDKYDSINEGYIKSDKDIYYNKYKFDSGEINLCFITGQSGSGKTTMAGKMTNDFIRLDDLAQNDLFSDENLKEYGNLIYSFLKVKVKSIGFQMV